jgi:hypothetical protein
LAASDTLVIWSMTKKNDSNSGVITLRLSYNLVASSWVLLVTVQQERLMVCMSLKSSGHKMFTSVTKYFFQTDNKSFQHSLFGFRNFLKDNIWSQLRTFSGFLFHYFWTVLQTFMTTIDSFKQTSSMLIIKEYKHLLLLM